MLDHLAEQFVARSCGATLDLFAGYNERLIAQSSRDLTTFQTPFGVLWLVMLPMGWTESVPIFHDNVMHILQPEIAEYTVPYGQGHVSRYMKPDITYETIPEHPGIRKFVWEH